MGLLEHVRSPDDLRDLTDAQLETLASEIRDELVRTCAPRGGHLGPNLGVVELTLAIHRVFESPRDRVVWDTGHQAYVHKMLTGRSTQFDTLRTEGGLSGYPSQAESDHDIVENSHASTSLSYADGLAKAYCHPGRGPLRRRRHRRRCPHRRHGLGGAEQHRHGQGPPPGHGRQRQRPVVPADRRRARHAPRVAADQPALRGDARPGQEAAEQDQGRRPGRVRRVARDEEGHEGRPGPAGHVRGPRPEVRRAHRRP